MPDEIQSLNAALEGRYRISRKVGQGGMSTVYLAEDLRHARPVALKVLRSDLAQMIGAERFLQEIRVTASLQHPNILPLFDSGEADGVLFYVMPYVEGESLRDRLARDGALDVPDAARILREIVDALAEAHARGVVHRDVKPANVLMAGRHALVADFGIAKAISDASDTQQLTTAGVAIGTPRYMAPEQAAADPSTDHRADLFAAGVVGYEMLTGTSPFAGDSMQSTLAALLTKTPALASDLRSEVPRALADVIQRCLAKDPADRWQSAADLLGELEALDTPAGGIPAAGANVPERWASYRIPALGLAAATVAWFVFFGLPGQDSEAWTRNEALPEIERLAEVGAFDAAYRLVLLAEEASPNDPEIAEITETVANRRTIETDPPGARVTRREYSAIDGDWEDLGTTPLQAILVPRGASRFHIELAGYRSVDVVSAGGGELRLPLEANDAIPPEMVRLPAFEADVDGRNVVLGRFLMDRFEVTNAEYKQFVDAGGYERREFWEHPFVDAGRTVEWNEAMARFVDRTGRPGPSSWEIGLFPEGQEDFPVGGVSWYEAAAYARFTGKSLTTVHHWRFAFEPSHQAYVVPLSNLEGTGPAAVGTYQGMTRFGTFDMAGNVREWCFNESDADRYILGGGWNDQGYTAIGPFAQSPFDRSETNGIRLVRYEAGDEALAAAMQPVEPTPVPDFESVEPVSDEVFAVYRRMFEYDPAPLNDRVERVDTARHWLRERITFDAAYGGERVVLYLYLPRGKEPPFQTVIYFPGSGALNLRSIDDAGIGAFDFVLRSGRAVALPAYQGTLDRGTDLGTQAREMGLGFPSSPRRTSLYREHVIQWAKDLSRTIDYLETRAETDTGALAYYGVSFGGRMGSLLLAIEPRFDAAVLNIAGFSSDVTYPEVNVVNYAPRVKTPVLMLSGRYDHIFPLETNALPMYRRLGTAEPDKRHVISNGGHFVPRTDLIRESLAWLDRYLGRVD